MKTLLLLAMLVPLGLHAEPMKKKAGLAGVWQQMDPGHGERPPMRLPVWKVLQNDGSFCTFLIANQAAHTIITNQGSYRATSDTTYVEHVTGSITDPSLVGRDNRITYRIVGKDKMEVTYRMPEAARETRETWVRVKLEMPK